MKNIKTMITFTVAASLSLLGAVSHFGDSAHSMALLSKNGGRVKHAAHFEAGLDRYVMIATATVLPPYCGDVRVAVENLPGMTWAIHNTEPVIDLGLHRQPVFRDHILSGVQPRDRLALWVVMRAAGKTSEPVTADAAPAQSDLSPGSFCCPGPEGVEAPEHNDKHRQPGIVSGPSLAFYDVASGQQVMRVPIHFESKEGQEQ